MPVDPNTPTTFRLLIHGKPERKFEAEATVPYAAMRWLIGLLAVALGMTTLLSVADAWATPSPESPSTTRPDDRGDEHGQGQGAGSDQGQGSGVGRGNDPSDSGGAPTTAVTTTTAPTPSTSPGTTSTTLPDGADGTTVPWPPTVTTTGGCTCP